MAERSQVQFEAMALDDLLPADHRARQVWAFVKSLDLTQLYQQIRAVKGNAGRNPIDPRILLALWLMATIEGISSARELARRCERDAVYRWICGRVGVNHHRLSDFRCDHGELYEKLVVDSVAALMHQDVITLNRVAQDGMRVRASAGSSSFRRRATLETCHQEAREHLEALKKEQQDDPSAEDRRRKAAQLRAAREREERIRRALEDAKQLEAQRNKGKETNEKQQEDKQLEGRQAEAENKQPADTKQEDTNQEDTKPTDKPPADKKKAPRVSTTDPEARNMKHGDGGFRPSFNVQFATDADTRMIVGVEVTNRGTDRGELLPMLDQLEENYGKCPDECVVDAGFPTKEDMAELERRNCTLYAPIHGAQRMLDQGKDPYSKRKGDNPAAVRFRQRMATEEAKEIYKQRPSVAEFPNADCRNRGLRQFRVRGLKKVKAVVMWHVLAFNFLRMVNLDVLPTS